MFSIFLIVRNNASTFYNYRTGKSESLHFRYTLILILSILLSEVFPQRSDNIYLGIITAQSVLAGFSFNVMIYLASSKKLQAGSNSSIEKKAKIDKINRLSEELFYNVSYFNLTAVATVIVAIALLLAPSFWDGWNLIGIHFPMINRITVNFWVWADPMLTRFVIFLLFSFTIESFITFIRTVQRSSYYFESRIALDQ